MEWPFLPSVSTALTVPGGPRWYTAQHAFREGTRALVAVGTSCFRLDLIPPWSGTLLSSAFCVSQGVTGCNLQASVEWSMLLSAGRVYWLEGYSVYACLVASLWPERRMHLDNLLTYRYIHYGD